MQDEQNKKTDIQLWDLVKNSTKKLKVKNNYLSRPKKNVSKKTSSSLNHEISNSINISSKKEKFKISNVEDINAILNFIDETNNGGVRNKDLKKLKSGKFTIQSKLDLHGFKLMDAEKMFYDFIHRNFEQSNRNLLIITGKGHQGKGKIKKDIHMWINKSSLLRLIIFYSYASPKDGGEGALYIRLRKNI